MTTIRNKYIGFSHPLSNDKRLDGGHLKLILNAWKNSNCIQGIHLWDEVWSSDRHCMVCDACNIEVHIEKVVIPDGMDEVV